MCSCGHGHLVTLRPGLALEFLGEDIAALDEHGAESQRVSGEAAEAIRLLLTPRRVPAAGAEIDCHVLEELIAKGFVVRVRGTSRRTVLAAGAAGMTALALPSRVAAESAGGSGNGLLIPGAPTNLAVTNGDSAVQISFTPGGDGGAPITNYEYSTDGGVTWHALDPADITSPITITRVWNADLEEYEPLENGVTYNLYLRAVNADEETGDPSSVVSFTPVAGDVIATGGFIDATSVGDEVYRIHSFTTDTTIKNLVLNEATDIEYLIVGGGGAGGGAKRPVTTRYGGGGGGAGGLRTGTIIALSAGTYTVTIGLGGTTNDSGNTGNSGQDSAFNSVTAAGGGGGGSYNNNGLAGGSGGGGGPGTRSGGTGNTPSVTPSQGNSGGTGGSTAGAGGGGASTSGGSASLNTPGVRGSGFVSGITGVEITYARGGNGGNSGVGGTAGGPAAGPGSGGGGGGYDGTDLFSASQGNAGIVVLRYRVPQVWD